MISNLQFARQKIDLIIRGNVPTIAVNDLNAFNGIIRSSNLGLRTADHAFRNECPSIKLPLSIVYVSHVNAVPSYDLEASPAFTAKGAC